MEIQEEIKTELEYMYQWFDCECSLAASAEINMPFNYTDFIEDGYKKISNRLNVSVELVKQIDACTQLSSLQ